MPPRSPPVSSLEWQGGIYSLNGEWTIPTTGRTYKDFYEVCNVGETDGIYEIKKKSGYATIKSFL